MDAAVRSYETIKKAFGEEEEADELEVDGAMDIVREEEEWETAGRKPTGSRNPSDRMAATVNQAPVCVTQLFKELFCVGKDQIKDGKVAKKKRFEDGIVSIVISDVRLKFF